MAKPKKAQKKMVRRVMAKKPQPKKKQPKKWQPAPRKIRPQPPKRGVEPKVIPRPAQSQVPGWQDSFANEGDQLD